MKIIEQSYRILWNPGDVIEKAARTCYRSEDRITDDGSSDQKIKEMLTTLGHTAMLEHSVLSVEFTTDRAIANELVRHRLCSFAQESTRYCNYSKDKFSNELTFVKPEWLHNYSTYEARLWVDTCVMAKHNYLTLLNKKNLKPEDARCVLPLSLATKLVMTTNYAEWRHILELRTSKAAHPQMRALMIPLLKELQETIPVIFDDIKVEE
jgi:thymidylate synthase (FAD)|nr:MAG TPA: Thymidylate synthase complementing protein [Caudoviricetes sp.]